MRVVVQRVSAASVTVEGRTVGAIDRGLLVFVGIGHRDTETEARWLAHKVANLRIFSDHEGKINLSCKDTGGAVLAVSQFTLYGDVRRGFRPSFTEAAPPEDAETLVQSFIEAVREEGVAVQSGIFQAHMDVSLVNDGPVTILLEREPRSDR